MHHSFWYHTTAPDHYVRGLIEESERLLKTVVPGAYIFVHSVNSTFSKDGFVYTIKAFA